MLFKRMNKRSLISNLVSIALLVVISIAIEGAFTLRSLVSWILIFSVSALALNIICGCLGEFVLGHGGFLLVGYTVAVLVGFKQAFVIHVPGIRYVDLNFTNSIYMLY